MLTSRLLLWERKVKGRVFVDLPFAPDPAAMALDDALDGDQADTGAFKLPTAMQALEREKRLLT